MSSNQQSQQQLQESLISCLDMITEIATENQELKAKLLALQALVDHPSAVVGGAPSANDGVEHFRGEDADSLKSFDSDQESASHYTIGDEQDDWSEDEKESAWEKYELPDDSFSSSDQESLEDSVAAAQESFVDEEDKLAEDLERLGTSVAVFVENVVDDVTYIARDIKKLVANLFS
uniref:Uncharacterized protein n=1 Tax=Steinernema glaseri TaxID=37863 RepID=A0A1I7XWH3_9BILA